MVEHADGREKGHDVTQAMPSAPPDDSAGAPAESSQPHSGRDRRLVAARFLGLFGSVVRWVGLVFALVLVVQVVFVVGEANRDNGIVSFIANVSRKFALGFKDLFTPDDPKLAVLVNYGIAALFWLIVSAVAARIIRRIADAGQPAR